MSKQYKLPVMYEDLTSWERRKVREQYIKEQDNKCAYCECSLSKPPPMFVLDIKIQWEYFPPNFLKYPVHLQHNHDTGLTEGAVHSYCNAVLWQVHGR